MMVRDVVRDCLEKEPAERTENDIGIYCTIYCIFKIVI